MKSLINNTITKYKDLKSTESNIMFSKLVKNLKIIESFINETESIFLSFNGGKDCLAALLVLKYYFYCKENNLNFSELKSYETFSLTGKTCLQKKIILVYFLRDDTFKEEINFVFDLSRRENFELIILNTDYKSGMYYLKQNFNLENIFMGVRKDDISSNQIEVSSDNLVHISDGNYPKFKRIYPIFQFDYNEIWMLILQNSYAYCRLYDLGYTSLGRQSKSFKNELLMISHFENNFVEENMNEGYFINEYIDELAAIIKTNGFYPAFFLEDTCTERQFRKND